MRQAKPQRVLDGGDQVAEAEGKQHAPEPARDQAVAHIADPVERQNPHAEKMPLQAMLGPLSDGDGFRKMKPAEKDFVIVDLPAAADHDDHRNGVDPVHDPDRQWMKNLSHLARSHLAAMDEAGSWPDGLCGRHGTVTALIRSRRPCVTASLDLDSTMSLTFLFGELLPVHT